MNKPALDFRSASTVFVHCKSECLLPGRAKVSGTSCFGLRRWKVRNGGHFRAWMCCAIPHTGSYFTLKTLRLISHIRLRCSSLRHQSQPTYIQGISRFRLDKALNFPEFQCDFTHSDLLALILLVGSFRKNPELALPSLKELAANLPVPTSSCKL